MPIWGLSPFAVRASFAQVESQSHSEVVNAPVEVCFDTVVDFARYPEWFSAISSARIIETNSENGQWKVAYELDMVIKTIAYTLAYKGNRPGCLEWKLAEGDIKDVEGSYVFSALEPRLTEARCTQTVDLGFWIPGLIKRGFERSALADSVAELKAAAEARAGAGG
jgi:ribosome-associated toxin RatA of RatAB toxin-antitoxin module